MSKQAFFWLPVCMHMAIIFAASSVPGTELPGHLWDKLAHLIVYAVLGVFFLLPLARGRLSGVTLPVAAKAVALSVLYGVFDELHQSLVPNRSPDFMDVVADGLGAASGIGVVLAVRLAVMRPGAR